MITDVRRIQFSPDAIREAVKLLRSLNPQILPPGMLGTIQVRQNSPIVLGISVQASGARTFRDFELEESEVAAMLILYCRKVKVPLPRSADKSIEGHGNAITLVVTKSVPLEIIPG